MELKNYKLRNRHNPFPKAVFLDARGSEGCDGRLVSVATSVHLPINRALIDDQQEKYGKEIPEQKELYSF